ncbi:MAG: ribosomal protein S18-alanine N-acetyltransferase [Zavarzinia sp.]|nr:ribosomal protein S18-alanine N-acetyltransferase [Zavarzinia sp.]
MTDTPEPRPVAPGDLEGLARVHGACFPDDPWNAERLGRLLAMPGAFALMVGGGFALLRTAADETEVITIAVAPDRRGAGLGRLLMTAALDAAARDGARHVLLEVAVDNDAALGLYRTLGFAEVGRRRAYYRRANTQPVDALVMSRTLFGQSTP